MSATTPVVLVVAALSGACSLLVDGSTHGGGDVEFLGHTDTNADGLSIAIPPPTGLSAGDLMIAAVATNGESALTMHADSPGWQVISIEHQTEDVSLGVWWKLATDDEGAHSFSWATSEDRDALGWIMHFDGVTKADPIQAQASAGGKSTIVPCPSLDTEISGSLVLCIGAFDTEIVDATNAGLDDYTLMLMKPNNSVGAGAGYYRQRSAGSSRSASFLIGDEQQFRTLTLALQ